MSTLKQIHIQQHIDAPYLLADTYMLETVLRNILTNAIKFSNEYGKITIRSHSENGMVKISISDNGIGMSEGALKTLFDVSQLRATSQSVSGLGLLICKNFVETMGGEIFVESKKNEGTHFHILLPEGKEPAGKKYNGAATLLNPENERKETGLDNKHPDNTFYIQNRLQPFIQSFSELSVYEASEVKSLIQEIRQIPNLEKEVEDWLSNLNEAVYLGDSELFDKLMLLLHD